MFRACDEGERSLPTHTVDFELENGFITALRFRTEFSQFDLNLDAFCLLGFKIH